MAGCCHGPACDAWYGIVMNGVRRLPVQLFEAIFLFALSGVTFVLFWKGKKYLMPLYMSAYGIWRIIAEILRDDYRGGIEGFALSPSQVLSIVLIAGGILLFVLEWLWDRKRAQRVVTATAAETAAADEVNHD